MWKTPKKREEAPGRLLSENDYSVTGSSFTRLTR